MIAPDFTASTTLSARANTWLCANPPTISPFSISVGALQVLASAITSEKSFFPSVPTGILFHPGNPAAFVVNILSLYVAFSNGGTIQLVVNTTGPLKVSNSSFCFHHAFP